MSILNVGTNVQISGTTQRITGVLGAPGIIPTGAVIYTASNTGAGTPVGSIPPGYLPCDGAAYNQSSYPELYAAIRDTFSTGSFGTALVNPLTGGAFAAPPAGQFRVPQLQGQFIRCWDGPVFTSTDPTPSGRIFASYQAWAIQNITGNLTGVDGGPDAAYNWGFKPGTSGAISVTQTLTGLYNRYNGQYSANSGSVANFDASRVVNTSTETRPRNIALYAIIKY
jgi:hypothetical protein